MTTIAISPINIGAWVVGACSSSVTRKLINAQLHPDSLAEKAIIWVGTAGIGGIVSAAARDNFIKQSEGMLAVVRTAVQENAPDVVVSP